MKIDLRDLDLRRAEKIESEKVHAALIIPQFAQFISSESSSRKKGRSATSAHGTCLEVILAEDLIEQVEHFELHTGDLVVLLRAFRPRLIHHLVHGAFPVFALGWLRGSGCQQGAQDVQLHGARGCRVSTREE